MKEMRLQIEELEARIAPIVIGGFSDVVSGEAVLEPTISASLTVTPSGGESIVEGCVSGASPGPGLTGLDLHHLETLAMTRGPWTVLKPDARTPWYHSGHQLAVEHRQ